MRSIATDGTVATQLEDDPNDGQDQKSRHGPNRGIALAESLGSLRRCGVALAIWERESLAHIQPALEALLRAPVALAIDQHHAYAGRLLESLKMHLGKAAPQLAIQALCDDIMILVEQFCLIADTSDARVRLERVEDDGCMLFHADTLRIRMLCTYAGPGTQWLEPNNVRMSELGLRGRTLDEANAAIVIDPDRICTIPAWHVAVFSGRLREDTPPLVHRSAPVKSRAEHRIRLCIDLPGDCGC